MVMVTRQPPPSYVPMVMVMMVMIFTYYWLYIRICICITLSPSLAARCSDTQRRAFRAALPLPMLGFGSSTASSTAPECRRRFFCRISSSGVSMYVSVWGRGCMCVCGCVGGRGSLSMSLYTGSWLHRKSQSLSKMTSEACFSTLSHSLRHNP